jgi:hypothetical protein
VPALKGEEMDDTRARAARSQNGKNRAAAETMRNNGEGKAAIHGKIPREQVPW